MPRVEPLEIEALSDFQEMFNQLEEFFGFLPNDYLTMAHRPAVLTAVAQLTQAVFFAEDSKISMELKLLLPYGASRAAGCMYCTGHSAALAARHGVSLEKIENIHMFKAHEAFTASDRAALTIAENAVTNPNSVSDEDFAELKKHFNDEQIAEIISVISVMGFYNRWNDTMATDLEKPPSIFSKEHITHTGWDAGKHE